MLVASNLEAATRHFEKFLDEIGIDRNNPHMAETPGRVARLYAELFTPQPYEFTTFDHDGADPVIVRDIPVTSWCAHHLLPFSGVVAIAYVPNGKIAGLSKLARLTNHCAAKPHVQERLTKEICESLYEAVDAKCVAVRMVANHSCMEARGVKAHGSETVTLSVCGDWGGQAALDAVLLEMRTK